MTDKKDAAGTPGIGKKPTPIIDLTATVVESSQPSVETRAAFADRTGMAAARPAAQTAAAASVPSSKPSAPADRGANVETAAKGASAAGATATYAESPAAGAAVTAPVKARSGLVSNLLSGVAGGALALLGATQLGPLLGAAGSAGVDTRIIELEQKLTRATAPDPAQRSALDARIAKLEEAAQALATGQVKIATELKSVDDKASTAVSALPAGAADKLTKLEEQLAQMVAAANANPQNAGRLPQLAQLTGKIGEVETQLATRTTQLKTELMQQMDQRFSKTGETLETTRSTLSQRAQSIEQTLKAVTDETSSLRAGVDAVKLDLDKRFAATVKPTDVQTAVASVATKVSALEQNMQGVVKSEQERNATAGNILLSLELANLKRALDRGSKYTSELSAVRKLAGEKLDLSVLEAQQNTGVPSLEVLGKELAQSAHTMLDAEAEPANASMSDRLLSGVKSIVRVRKVDFALGDASMEAVIARMELALKEGRVADTLDESKKLSPKAAAAGTKWLDRIKTRAAVDSALAALDASLKTSLAGGATPKKVTN